LQKLTPWCRLALIAIAASFPINSFAYQSIHRQRSMENKQPRKAVSLRATLNIPRIERAPTLADFEGMEPVTSLAQKMARAEGFRQRNPSDGAPATQSTFAFMGYDNANIYLAWVCHDDNPSQIRSQLTKRENATGDDFVEVIFDTYKDQRRGYVFASNPIGIQTEGLWSEDNGTDYSWDTVWKTNGVRTAKGYVVIMSIPFRSLRFSHDELQQWGITLHRAIPRNNEDSYWPFVSSKINGTLNQAGTLTGLEHISPGRNIEINPYGLWRASRSLNSLDAPPRFEGETLGGRMGTDAKMVIKDSLVLDLTINPDFSQIESDEPQLTVNQRFPVFFPEKRPFFLENSNYFNTPYTLLYTRNIVDPEYGARLTGKLNKLSLGFIFANDRSPGQSVPVTDPAFGKKANFAIGRVNYDILKQSTIGLIYTDREFDGGFNRVGGIDGSFKWRKNYFANFQALATSTRHLDGSYSAGPAFQAGGGYSGRKFNANTYLEDNSAGYQTQVGFFSRPDYIRFSNFISYRWRPEGKFLVSFGPNFFEGTNWDHSGVRLDYQINPSFNFEFKHNTLLRFTYNAQRSQLRPKDYSTLTTVQDYANGGRSVFLQSDYFQKVSFSIQGVWGNTPNVIPASGPPRDAFEQFSNVSVTVKPVTQFQITTTYLGDFWQDTIVRNQSLYNTHIIRSKWNYQINKEISVRFIGQYNTNLSHANLVALDTTKNFNYDLLLTWLLHPGTAVYVGYNSNLSTLDPRLISGPNGLVQRSNQYINDGKQFFIKVNYLFRF
jgi:hypothetical protein